MGNHMAQERIQRRLAAVLAADVVGYSRLMEDDETGTLVALQALQSNLIEPAVVRHGGRLVKLMGDGVLVEFPSVIEAVQSAVDIQREISARNRTVSERARVALRIGLHVGDVIVENEDLYGDGVNIASRLEGIATTGGIYLSRQAYDQVEGKLALDFRPLGPQTLKNIKRPIEVFALDVNEDTGKAVHEQTFLEQEIRYCRTSDHVRLAWAKVGHGPPLVRTAHWMTHLEYDWANPLRRTTLQKLARRRTLIRYDARGNGLSDWDVSEVSLDAWIGDLETVVEAAGLSRFPLIGISQGCAVSIAYSVRHPQRVSRLILYGGFALGGYRRSSQEREQRKAMATLMRMGWGTDDPTFRQLFTSRMMPDATKEQADAYNELQRLTASAECAARYFDTVNDFDVRDLLPKVSVPTLVMHTRGDLMQPFEEGRRLAADIPGARFVALEGRNHVFLPGKPATERFSEELEMFLQE
jgi:class 3 adenylate cyclase/pimeloyl-ACP methyl ester carboxylesterase